MSQPPSRNCNVAYYGAADSKIWIARGGVGKARLRPNYLARILVPIQIYLARGVGRIITAVFHVFGGYEQYEFTAEATGFENRHARRSHTIHQFMTNTPLVSIITPSFNQASFIGEAL